MRCEEHLWTILHCKEGKLLSGKIGDGIAAEPRAKKIFVRTAADIACLLSLTPATDEQIAVLHEKLFGPTPACLREPKPNIWCEQCRHPLAIRPPNGPRGESPPPVIWVKLGRVPFYAGQPRLLWELPDGTTTRAFATNATEEYRIASAAHRAAWLLASKEHTSMDPLVREELRRQNRRIAPPDRGWIVRLERWKKSYRLASISIDGNYRIYRSDVIDPERGEPPSVVPFPLPYHGYDGVVRYKDVMLPLDATPLFRGTVGRCPKCRSVQALE